MRASLLAFTWLVALGIKSTTLKMNTCQRIWTSYARINYSHWSFFRNDPALISTSPSAGPIALSCGDVWVGWLAVAKKRMGPCKDINSALEKLDKIVCPHEERSVANFANRWLLHIFRWFFFFNSQNKLGWEGSGRGGGRWEVWCGGWQWELQKEDEPHEGLSLAGKYQSGESALGQRQRKREKTWNIFVILHQLQWYKLSPAVRSPNITQSLLFFFSPNHLWAKHTADEIPAGSLQRQLHRTLHRGIFSNGPGSLGHPSPY